MAGIPSRQATATMVRRLAVAAVALVLAVPASASADPVVVAAGDMACGTGSTGMCAQQSTSDVIGGLNPTVVLALGDEQYENGALSEFQSFYGPSWGRYKGITRPAPGNHEYSTAGAAGYFDYYDGVGAATGLAGERGTGYYSFDVGTWHLIALNSNCASIGGCSAGSAQEAWLRADLAAHPSTCSLAYIHHPRWSSDTTVGDQTQVSPLVQDLYAAHVDLMLAGHSHTYERFGPQSPAGVADQTGGLTEIIAGTGGKSEFAFGASLKANSLANASTLGVLALTLHPSSYDTRFVPSAGQTFTDSSVGLCHNGSGTVPPGPTPTPTPTPTASGPTSPVASTAAATAITKSAATLNGSVTPNGSPTSYYFDYGTSTSYGSQTATSSAGSGSVATPVAAAISGLAKNRSYHFRIVARWSTGETATGADRSFTTPTH